MSSSAARLHPTRQNGLRELIKRLAAGLGVRVSRTAPHRFDALDQVLQHLSIGGFRPSSLIDAGANRGQWATRAVRCFPGVPIMLVEPQAACQESLRVFAAKHPQARIQATALTKPGVEAVWMDASAWAIGSTGARVLPNDSGHDRVEVPASTLDEVLLEAPPHFSVEPLFLKLDLEGHEVAALQGASATLAKTEVVLCETRLLGNAHDSAPDFENLLDLLRARGFVLYDFVSLSGRPGDDRLRLMDVVFVRRGGRVDAEREWVVESPRSR
jgi:FkbM family methyltransferase